MNQNLKIEYIPIEDIKPYSNNAKTHPAEQIQQIKNSILEFGFKDPIAIWHNTIVEGHGRLLAAQELGYKELPIIRLDDLSDEQRKAYCLAHNKLTMNSDFDLDVLSAELDSITDIDMSDFGFDLDLPDFDEPAEVVEDDYNEEPPAEPKSKLGDIYQLGRHRLMCGDSTSIENVKELTGGELIDMLLTDPPYNVAYEGKTKDKLTIKNDSIHPTMKPIGLFDYQIQNNTKGGDIVLDLFDGSGTTIMACEQNGRKAYCMELDPRYVDAAIDRWEKFTGQKAVKLN